MMESECESTREILTKGISIGLEWEWTGPQTITYAKLYPKNQVLNFWNYFRLKALVDFICQYLGFHFVHNAKKNGGKPIFDHAILRTILKECSLVLVLLVIANTTCCIIDAIDKGPFDSDETFLKILDLWDRTKNFPCAGNVMWLLGSYVLFSTFHVLFSNLFLLMWTLGCRTAYSNCGFQHMAAERTIKDTDDRITATPLIEIDAHGILEEL
ncbi:hypothetical protein EDC01DRAFT_427091 [Geopyxis carbonaria]|nr:hypothetical protein EDC01DRAFT_427091 [Geopyxis carbonaria]